MGVRHASSQDVDCILQLCISLHKESSFRELVLNENKLRIYLAAGAERKQDLFLNVYESATSIQGFLFGNTYSPFFSDDLVASDFLFYVRPEARGGIAAYRLWSHFRDWAREKGVSEIRQGVSTGIAVERADLFFRRLGMEATGQNYRLKLP